MSSVINTVARIAYLASDSLVDSQPPLPATSVFLQTFKLLQTSSRHSPKVLKIPDGGDPATALLQTENSQLISFTAQSSSQTVIKLLMYAVELSDQPLVLHLAVHDDLSDVLLLRSALPFFLLSTTAQQAHDNALLASKLARKQTKAVVHVFYTDSVEAVSEISEDDVLPFVLDTNRLGNGHVNTEANGSNGHAEDSELTKLYNAFEQTALSTVSLVRRPLRATFTRGSSDPHTVILVLGKDLPCSVDGVSFVSITLATPLLVSTILSTIPPSAKRVIVLEQAHRWSMKWTPLYLDVINALQQRDIQHRPITHPGLLGDCSQISDLDVLKFIEKASSSPSERLQIGTPPSYPTKVNPPHIPRHESSYTKILTHLFGDRLEIANSPSLVATHGNAATTPEFALGRVRGQIENRTILVSAVQDALRSQTLDPQLHLLLSRWLLVKDDAVKSRTLGNDIVSVLESGITAPAAQTILSLRAYLPCQSKWIIGSDAWSYDLGSSGLHHAIASGLNINILILDTLPYSSRNSGDSNRRKQDVGLYAMNHGDVYVASVAVYSSYSHVLQAFTEADRYDGPSVILGYLPYETDSSPALDILKETKLAVDTGYWPLYRWDPVKERAGKEPFSLDSDAVKNDLQQFLDRHNHLSQLVNVKPKLATEIVNNLGDTVKEARRKKAEQSYNDLLVSLDAPPLSVLYASDGGSAEKIAKRLVNRSKARGLTVSLATMDSMSLESLSKEECVVFITSTAGQGEPPQNGRQFFKALNAAVTNREILLSTLQYAVFGMGDSHYWPRPEDAHYYNKPSKDLDARLEKLGGQRLVDLGLGDDQNADGPETGYKLWEPLLWKALKVDSVEVTEAEPEPITNEHIKAASQYLRGTIIEGLGDTTTGALAPSDGQLTKFHGIYQQDDRDIRDERQAQGIEPAYSFMIRVRMPGGVCKPDQWLQMDQIADEHGSGTFKITTRQTFQFHGVIKRHLKPAIRDINRALLDTLAACGDVNRCEPSSPI